MNATEEAGGPPQLEEAPLPAADLPARGPGQAEMPSGVTGQPKNQHASTPANRPPDMAARESGEAPDAGQPGTRPGTFDFTGHKVAKTRILSKWLTKVTQRCCVLSLF